MIKVEHTEVWGFNHAIRGMRNPMNSWDKSDSEYSIYVEDPFVVGKNDLELMQKLYKGGSEHRKYLRQIFVSMDIIAPLYWWKEFDTYKIGTTANSCSTMHKIHSKEFEIDDFSHEHLFDEWKVCLHSIIGGLNKAREEYLKTNNRIYWWQLIQLLPSSYNQKRTITMNYENVVNVIHQREGHKLDEWNKFCDVLYNLPYVKDIIKTINKEENVDDKRTIMNLVSKLKKLKRQVSYWKHKYLKLKERTKNNG